MTTQNYPGSKIWGLITLVLLLTACSGPSVTFHTADGDVSVDVEVADDNQEHAKGLMGRESLDEDAGILFVFEEEAQRTFWMKDTLIPLDMIFIGADFVVDEVKSNVPPCKVEDCPTFPGQMPAKYVVEVNGGFAQENGIKKGVTVTING